VFDEGFALKDLRIRSVRNSDFVPIIMTRVWG